MKKLLLSVTAVVAALSLNAQDTLTEFFTGTTTYYTVTNNGGYVTGNNSYGDLAKGMRFNAATGLNGGGTVNSVLLTVPAKLDGGGGSITVKIHAFNPADTLGAELGSVVVPLASIDTSAAGYHLAEGKEYNVVATFAAPVTIPGDIIVMVTLPTGNSACLMPSNTDGDFMAAISNTFEIWSDGTIHDFNSAWGLDIAMPIYITGDMVLGIAENDIVQASVFPNPTANILNVKSSEAIASIVVMTMDGKTVAAANGTSVNVADLTAGIYMYAATTASGKVARGNFAKN